MGNLRRIREVPYYGKPTQILAHDRINGRAHLQSWNVEERKSDILKALNSVARATFSVTTKSLVMEIAMNYSLQAYTATKFGKRRSKKRFIDILGLEYLC